VRNAQLNTESRAAVALVGAGTTVAVPAFGKLPRSAAPGPSRFFGREAALTDGWTVPLEADPMDLERLSDEELIARIRQEGEEAEACREALFKRYYRKVAFWCLKVCGNHDRATDLAQEVFLRVHERLHTFRLESRFSTWLYTVTRRVAINRGQSERRREAASLDAEEMPEPTDPSRDAEDLAASGQLGRELRRAMERDLEPLESRVLYLHFVDGLTLPAITELLDLTNKSGAKAYIVSAKRKLHRRFGRWLARQTG
jgi:RNA polymerase sigma-70 factor (ECF subfamily)